MANQEQLALLKQGVKTWNQWREEHTDIQLDFSGANLHSEDLSEANLSEADLSDAILGRASLSGADLSGADLSGAKLGNADLSFADLSGANLYRAYLGKADLVSASLYCADLHDADLSKVDLSEADLSSANLYRANLDNANLSKANLSEANLSEANLSEANLSEANLRGADLSKTDLRGADLDQARLVETNLRGANLTGCSIYGISAWDVQLEGAEQLNMTITPYDQPAITIDNLKIAQFIYLLLNNAEIRDVIDTITSKVVLILGRFTPERKAVLDVLRNELRKSNYSPVLFDFEKPASLDVAETVRTLANMAHFVLLDLTNLDDVIPGIADDIVPRCVVPIRPLLLQGSHRQEYEPFRDLGHKHRWVLAPYRYKDLSELQSSFQEKILQPIYERVIELKQKKPLKIFIGYAPKDTIMLDALKTHLRPLERAGLIESWDDRNIKPGAEPKKEIERHFSEARIVILLLSPDFLDSDACHAIQERAIERYEGGEVRVIPILLRPCAWQFTSLKELQPLPKDGKPVSKLNRDEVFNEVNREIGNVIQGSG
ncbi:MAG: toll/interleukin-1 receptor domain-containing protein [Ktedonobacteraceae bacterium]|nr:toll/interleukin-1 receptor domain-containing protein [Ktedonobacteraceae bacterium]